MTTLPVAALRTRLVLQAPVDTPDDTGAFTRSWTDVSTLWARVVTASAEQHFTADSIEAVISLA